MSLEVISIFCFGFLEEIAKRRNLEFLGIIRLLLNGAGNPCSGLDLRRSMGHPCRNEAKVPKMAPLGYVTA